MLSLPIAPSFESYNRISTDTFIKNGKYHITVEHPKTGNRRDIRYYSETEYAKLYSKKVKVTTLTKEFDQGPILVIRNNRPADEPWLRASAHYCIGIGWYIASTELFPKDPPVNLKYLLLGRKEYEGKTPVEVSNILDKKAKNKEWIDF